jgi:mono/diheme cytochrome c family protein
MPRCWNPKVAALSFCLIACCVPYLARNLRAQISSASKISFAALHAARSSRSDLELGGELAGLPVGTTRYITRETLLALPQVNYTVSDDANFTGATQIAGVSLEKLAKDIAASPESDLVVAACSDKYHANYPRTYVAAHQPVLVLTINGQPPERWPKDVEGRGLDMGPYLISHPKFTPSFRILSHADEAQIPWGVVRLEFRDEKAVFGAIAPRGPRAAQPNVLAGYRIAQQDCFRCHNMGNEGGQKAGRPWEVLAEWAAAAPDRFGAYIRDPKSKNPHAEMPGNPTYDAATIGALRAYFETFAEPEKP